jgi:hypothetical protein
MAQIPVPTFGQAVASPAQAIQVGQTDVSSGLQAVGQGLMNEGIRINQQQNAAKAALALATATNAANTAHDEVARGVMTGDIAPEDAQPQLKQRLDAIQQVQTQGLNAVHASAVKTQLAGVGGNLSRNLDGTIYKYQQSETAANLDALGGQLQQDAQRRGPGATADTYDAALDLTGSSAGFTPAQIAEKKLAFRQATTAGYYDNKGAALHAAGDLPGVTATLHEVLGPAGEVMAPVQRAQVTNHLVGLQNHLMAAQQRADDQAERDRIARENAGADAYNQAEQVVLNGQYLSPDAIADVSAKTAGTSLEQRTTALLAAQTQTARFAALPAPQRAAALEHYHSEGANPNVGTSPDNQKSIAILQKIDSAANSAAADDPWKAAQSYGVIISTPAMDASHPDGLLGLLDQRMQKIGQVEAWTGKKVSPFQPAEADQISESLKGMSPAQAANALSMIGKMVGDPQRIAAVGKQLGDKDGTMGLAMAYAGDRTETGKLTSEYILRGTQALKDKTSLVDTTAQTGWKATIAQTIRGAFSSQQAEDQAIEAAYKITAARDSTGEASGDTETAIRMATGGIITHGLGKIPLPMGVDEKTFDQRIKQFTPALLAPQAPDGNAYVGGTAMPMAKFVASLPDATLVHAGQGLYVVRAGNSFVTNVNGQRIVLKVSQ